jgi:hypothetical protein
MLPETYGLIAYVIGLPVALIWAGYKSIPNAYDNDCYYIAAFFWPLAIAVVSIIFIAMAPIKLGHRLRKGDIFSFLKGVRRVHDRQI